MFLSQLPGLHVELRLLPITVALLVSLLLCYSYSTVILSGGIGKNGSSVAVSYQKMCTYVNSLDYFLLHKLCFYFTMYFLYSVFSTLTKSGRIMENLKVELVSCGYHKMFHIRSLQSMSRGPLVAHCGYFSRPSCYFEY